MKTKSSKLEEKYHDFVAEMYNTRRSRDYIWEVPEEMFLFDKSFFSPPVNVVEMGCGPAITISRILDKAILKHIFYTGIDISRNLLRFAKINVPNGQFMHADMSSVKLLNDEFDILIALGALHHCENKKETLNNWVKFVKPGGLMILREPLYEFLKRGTGESPTEEGVKINELLAFIRKRKLRVIRLTFFNTNAFHLFNRIMIKIGLKSWARVRLFWYPVVTSDAFLARFSKYGEIFKPQAFAVILQKP